jgi:hypothetical protein
MLYKYIGTRCHTYQFHFGGHSGFALGMKYTGTGPFRCTVPVLYIIIYIHIHIIM